MRIIQDLIPASNRNRPRTRMNPQYITVHNTANTTRGADARSHANYLKSGAGGRSVSWHYTVDDTVIVQHLPTNEIGWHAGDGAGKGNRQSIGIEICENADGDYNKAEANAIWLIRKLMGDHNIPMSRVVTHKHWSGKNCPRKILGRWSSFKRSIEGTVETASPSGSITTSGNETGLPSTKLGDKGQTVRDLQRLLLDAGESLPRFGDDGHFGAETEAAVQSFQRKHGLSSPSGNYYGVAGPTTTTKLVELYQQKHGISSPAGNFFGVFGPATKEALRGGFSFRHWNGNLIRNGDRGNSVKDLQERLISLGYALPRFGADGVMGDETAQAVRAFQRDAGIGVDGKPGAQTHRALEGV